MFFYWRVQQDLNCLGEVILFHDFRFIRCHQQWLRRNLGGIALAEEVDLKSMIWQSMN